MPKTQPCPTCQTAVAPSSPHWPFCSERCQQQDLYQWLTGGYRIAAEPAASTTDAADGQYTLFPNPFHDPNER